MIILSLDKYFITVIAGWIMFEFIFSFQNSIIFLFRLPLLVAFHNAFIRRAHAYCYVRELFRFSHTLLFPSPTLCSSLNAERCSTLAYQLHLILSKLDCWWLIQFVFAIQSLTIGSRKGIGIITFSILKIAEKLLWHLRLTLFVFKLWCLFKIHHLFPHLLGMFRIINAICGCTRMADHLGPPILREAAWSFRKIALMICNIGIFCHATCASINIELLMENIISEMSLCLC